ncbi:MAG TPA: shikimate kinase [Pyrinomonadaceae bacterium]|nr:shikimate kinase [Pyrinomonadaceae bacterium]
MNTRRIVILGFMASGKTTVGEELARQLNCGFVDLDSFIGSREGRSPAEIITQDGQAAFRELETLALRDVLQDREAHVIALGGGTWLKAANRTMVALFDCITVWLDTPFETCWERISNSATVRPLAPNLETARKRFDERRAFYALAARRIAVESADNAERVVEKLFRET